MNANSDWIRSLWETVPIVSYPEFDPYCGPVPIRLGMLVGRVNPLVVRVHIGVEEERHERRANRSSLSN